MRDLQRRVGSWDRCARPLSAMQAVGCTPETLKLCLPPGMLGFPQCPGLRSTRPRGPFLATRGAHSWPARAAACPDTCGRALSRRTSPATQAVGCMHKARRLSLPHDARNGGKFGQQLVLPHAAQLTSPASPPPACWRGGIAALWVNVPAADAAIAVLCTADSCPPLPPDGRCSDEVSPRPTCGIQFAAPAAAAAPG